MRYRPPSTSKYPGDNEGRWAFFWHMEALERLSESDMADIGSFRGYNQAARYGRGFVPRGPADVTRAAYSDAFVQRLIHGYRKQQELRTILFTDTEARERLIDFFHGVALRIAHEERPGA